MYIVETVSIGERERVVVFYDTDASSPRDDDHEVVMFPLHTNNNYSQLTAGTGRDATWLFLENAVETHGWDTDEFGECVTIFFNNLRISHMIHEFTVYRDWFGTYLLYGMNEFVHDPQIEAHADDLQNYVNGSVYILQYQQKNTYASVDSPDRTIEVWDDVEAVGGVYMDEFTIENVVDYFDGITLNDMEVSK